MAEPPAADHQPPLEEWDPLQAEYDDLRTQERERNHRDYLKRIRRELDRTQDDDG